MDHLFSKLFDTSDFPARWYCGNWTAQHGWTHIVADALIFGAYIAIPILILYYMYKRPDVPFPRIGWFFAGFIFFCGTGHLMEALIFWWPNYRLDGVIKVGTAVASWATVVAVAPLLPRALQLPGLNALVTDLEREIQERERAEAGLRQRNQDLQMLLHIISHDLREPLRGVRGLSSLLGDRYAHEFDDRGREILDRIDVSGQRLDALIRDLNYFARAQSGAFQREPVALADAVEEAMDRLRTRIEATGAVIRVEPDLPEVVGDRNWITQGIYNLLSNAIKYTPEGRAPEIEVAAVRKQDAAGIVVRDRGMGVDEKCRESIFDLFRRGAGNPADGTGAGLAIVRTTAARHGGRAWVEPRDSGGSAFYITFGATEPAPSRN